jgi:tetratricopeptide (TPR) repeat protein
MARSSPAFVGVSAWVCDARSYGGGGRERHDDSRFEFALSYSWNEMGRLEIQSNRLPQPQEMFEKSRDLRQHLVDRAPQELDYQRKLANSLMNLGAVYGPRNQLPEALEWTRRSIEMHQGLVNKDPNNAPFRRDLAKAPDLARAPRWPAGRRLEQLPSRADTVSATLR